MASIQSEGARLHALKQLKLLDTPPSESFDRITRMASQLFDVTIQLDAEECVDCHLPV